MFEAKVREFLKVELKKRVSGFRDGSLRRFRQRRTILWLFAEDIVLQEVVADLDFDVNEVSSVQQCRTGVNESNGYWDEDIAIGTGGVGGRGQSTIDSL